MKICLNTLRLKLGWSRHEMVRWLGCSAEDYNRWMATQTVPADVYNSRVAMLSMRLEQLSRRVQSAPMAEQVLESENLSQVGFYFEEKKAA